MCGTWNEQWAIFTTLNSLHNLHTNGRNKLECSLQNAGKACQRKLL